MFDILDRIRKIEALILGASTPGEQIAALNAKDRILKRYPELELNKNTKEYALHTLDNWHKKLLLAICHKYGIKPYRYRRQKYTTVMVNINEQFLNEVLWKEFLQYSKELEALIQDITDTLINKICKPEDEIIIQGELEDGKK
jgi:hypothetical protein